MVHIFTYLCLIFLQCQRIRINIPYVPWIHGSFMHTPRNEQFAPANFPGRFHLPTIHFPGLSPVSFREGNGSFSQTHGRIFVSHISETSLPNESSQLSPIVPPEDEDAARRFITFVDVAYDHKRFLGITDAWHEKSLAALECHLPNCQAFFMIPRLPRDSVQGPGWWFP